MTFMAEMWGAVSEYAATPGGRIVMVAGAIFSVFTILMAKIGGRRW